MLKYLRSTAAWRPSIWTTLAFAIGSALAFLIVYALVAKGIRGRSDAWLIGEAEVLSQVARETPRDSLYHRIVEEVAELATQEVPDERNSRGQRLNSVFFLQTEPDNSAPLWVGPGPKEPFQSALKKMTLVPGVPRSVRVEGWKEPFRVVVSRAEQGRTTYLGLSDRGALRLLHGLIYRFLEVWGGMVVFGFLISYLSARRTLLRVERITETVGRIGSRDLGERLPEAGRSDEIARLASTFNHMLDRIQASVNQLRTVTGAVAHDLKSPVTSIRGSLEVALSDGESGAWRESVAEAIEGLDSLSQLLNTTLDLAEAEAGALNLSRERVDFSRTLRQIVELYEPALADRRHQLELDLQQGVIVDADRALLNRTLSNLLENELNHLPPGCTIEIRLRSQDGAAELVITDNGPGFPPDIRTRAFDRFVKGKQSPGHGLGLAFVDAVVQAHGGTAKIIDQPDRGAVIRVLLPALQPA
jgi:signal transduction histidine kinase